MPAKSVKREKGAGLARACARLFFLESGQHYCIVNGWITFEPFFSWWCVGLFRTAMDAAVQGRACGAVRGPRVRRDVHAVVVATIVGISESASPMRHFGAPGGVRMDAC